MPLIDRFGPAPDDATNENWGVARLRGEVEGDFWVKYTGTNRAANRIIIREEDLLDPLDYL